MGSTVTTFNIICLVIIYAVLVVLMFTYFKKSLNNNAGSDEDDDNGGGWDNPNDTPTIDLPPGVFFLSPNDPDPSSRRKPQKETEVV
ncbi:hypothetical protein [Algivirga pacifica]|uniref:Uncharacterized protein n=1 Tax=Algivirga pacifica TaxID=1162670 RepID=A0ABP9DID9_9BACT